MCIVFNFDTLYNKYNKQSILTVFNIFFHWKIPTLALLNNLPWIVYPVLIVVATVLAVQPGKTGICKRLSWVLGSNSFPVGSNSSISKAFKISANFFWVSIIFKMKGSLESGYSFKASVLHLLTQSAASRSSLAILVIEYFFESSTYLKYELKCTCQHGLWLF